MRRVTFPIQLRSSRLLHPNPERILSHGRLAELLTRWAGKAGEKTFAFLKFHWLGIVNFQVSLFIIGALLAPFFQHLDWSSPSKILYGFYGLFCHQKESRCFLLLNHPVAICARCLSFYSACLLMGIWISLRRLQPIDLKLATLLIVPGAVDALLQILQIRESGNLMRTTTGALMGLAFSAYLIPRAQEGMRFLIQKVPPDLKEEVS